MSKSPHNNRSLATIPKRNIPTLPAANISNKHNHTNTNTTKNHNSTNEFSTSNHHDKHTESPISSHTNKDTNDNHMVDNPYNFEDTREHLINNTTTITFERDRHTDVFQV